MCNKIDFSFCANMHGGFFANPVTYIYWADTYNCSYIASYIIYIASHTLWNLYRLVMDIRFEQRSIGSGVLMSIGIAM